MVTGMFLYLLHASLILVLLDFAASDPNHSLLYAVTTVRNGMLHLLPELSFRLLLGRKLLTYFSETVCYTSCNLDSHVIGVIGRKLCPIRLICRIMETIIWSGNI